MQEKETYQDPETPESQVLEEEERSNGLAVVAIIFAIVFFALAIWLFVDSRKQKRNLENANAQIETLTSQKNEMQKELTLQQGTNINLGDSLVLSQRQIIEKEVMILRLNQENQNLMKLQQKVRQLEQVYANMNSSNETLRKLHQDLNRMIDSTRTNNANISRTYQ